MAYEDDVRKISSMVDIYQSDPAVFTDNDVQQLMQMAQAVGIPFEPKSSIKRKIGVFAGEAVDTALLGAVPEGVKLQPRTTGERYSGMAGDVAGMITPGGLPSVLGKKAATFAAHKMGRLGQLATKGQGVPATQAAIRQGGLKAVGGTKDLGVYAGQRLSQGGRFTAKQMEKFGLKKQAKAFRNFMDKQGAGLQALGRKGFGKPGEIFGKVAESPTLQNVVSRGIGFGAQVAAGDLTENIAGGNFDQIISDFMGGASVGAIGGFLSGKAFSVGKNKLFNIRNLAKAIVVHSAGQGIPMQEDKIYARLLTLAGLTVGRGRI